jgi:hypothetical protein
VSHKTVNPGTAQFAKNTLALCIGLTLAGGMALQPSLAEAKSKRHQPTRQEIELEEENAELRRQVSALQTQLNTAPATSPSPFSAQPIPKSTAATAAPAAAATPAATQGGMACGANMKGGGMQMEPGSKFLMNPVWGGLDMFWNMPKDSVMMNVKWMHNQQNGLGQGTNAVGMSPAASPYNQYMMPSLSQSMDMFMFMPMWGVTEDITLMAMINYMYMSMPNNMNMPMMGVNNVSMSPMNNGGIMDTDFDLIYRISHDFVGTFQVSAPTGSTQQAYNPAGMAGYQPGACNGFYKGTGCWNQLTAYGMQMGAGVPGLMPALTYNWITADEEWNLGGQASYNAYAGTNNGWSPGNMFKLSLWAQHELFDDWTVWLRSNFTDQAQIQGCSNQISGVAYCQNPSLTNTIMPGFNPSMYGGKVATLLLGFSYTYGMFSIGVEGGIPVYQNLNVGNNMTSTGQPIGAQLMNAYYINAGTSFMF